MCNVSLLFFEVIGYNAVMENLFVVEMFLKCFEVQ